MYGCRTNHRYGKVKVDAISATVSKKIVSVFFLLRSKTYLTSINTIGISTNSVKSKESRNLVS